jgi:hypothetical protein
MYKEVTYYDSFDNKVKQDRRYYPDKFSDEKGYQFWTQKHACRVFADVPFPKEMTIADIGRMTILSKHIYRDSNVLAYRGNGGVRPYDMDGMAKLLDVKERQAYRFVEKMIRLEVMAKGTFEIGGSMEQQYFISPIYFFSGKYINHTLYMLFRNQLNKTLPKWVVDRYNGISGEVRPFAARG